MALSNACNVDKTNFLVGVLVGWFAKKVAEHADHRFICDWGVDIDTDNAALDKKKPGNILNNISFAKVKLLSHRPEEIDKD
ncbi:hypothetical protein KFU94_54600 [Chloroflexi bacterium TSY]|nr:hypothetical protein [Chloroflexi bacterium TSY]